MVRRKGLPLIGIKYSLDSPRSSFCVVTLSMTSCTLLYSGVQSDEEIHGPLGLATGWLGLAFVAIA